MAYGHEILHEAAFTDSDDCIFFTDAQGRQRKVAMFGRRMTAARAVWVVRHGLPQNGLYVLHSCSGGSGRWGCVNVNHLYLGTPKENTTDMIEDRDRHSRAKLTPEEVLEIRQIGGSTPAERAMLAEKYGVGPGTIRAILNRVSWRHI